MGRTSRTSRARHRLPEPAVAGAARFGQMLPALIADQIGLYATMAGIRMAAPLQALREGCNSWKRGSSGSSVARRVPSAAG
jgi:hypothetical protein